MANKPRIIVAEEDGEAETPESGAAPAAPAVKPAPKQFAATICPTTPEVNPDFAALVAELEQALGYPIWLLAHGRSAGDWDAVDRKLCNAIRGRKAEIALN